MASFPHHGRRQLPRALAVVAVLATAGAGAHAADYHWPRSSPAGDTLASRISPPPGFEREMKLVALADIAAGDPFIKGGFPGHAVLVAGPAGPPSGMPVPPTTART